MHLLAMVPQVTPLAGVWVEIPPGDTALDCSVILSILVDTFISKISLPMQPVPEIGSISVA